MMDLLLPMGGGHSHVTVRNHTLAVFRVIEEAPPPSRLNDETSKTGVVELGVDVGYVRTIRSANPRRGEKTSLAIAVAVAAVGGVGKSPQVWVSTNRRNRGLRARMVCFLSDSAIDAKTPVHVITNGARDLSIVTKALPNQSRNVLDWAHIGRLTH